MKEYPDIHTALITGSATRIGREMALHLARAGWDVALHCHHSRNEATMLAQAIEEMGRRCEILSADLTHHGAVSSLIAQAAQALGPLSLLVHNAAIFQKEGLADFSHETFAAHMAVNLEAPLHLSRDFAAQVLAGSQIICLLDGMEGWSLSGAYLAYALSKQGLREVVRLLAPVLAPAIRINGIAPGASLAGMQDGPATFARLARLAPLRRVGSPEEIVQAMEYLLHAPGVSGQVLDLANGMGMAPLLASDRDED